MEDSDPADIFAADLQAKVSAEGGERKVVAYKTGLRGVPQALVQYGPDNCAKYRLEVASKEDLIRHPELNISDPQRRKGEMHSFATGSKVYKYGKDDVKAIQRVFLPSGRLNPLDAVNPDLKDKRFEPIIVRITWKEQINRAYSFETRTTFKRLWRATTGHKKDIIVYKVAQVGEGRWEEYISGQRKAEDRSPTVDPNFLALEKTPKPRGSQERSESPKVAETSSTAKGKGREVPIQELTPPASQNGTPGPSKSPQPKPSLKEDSEITPTLNREEWLKVYCDFYGPLEKMNDENRALMISSWTKAQQKAVQEAKAMRV